MKIRISDMLDHMDGLPVNVNDRTDANPDTIKSMTLQKVHAARKTTRRLPKLGVIAAVLALCLLGTVTVFACVNWTGFAFTGGMTHAEKQAILQDNDNGTTQLIEPDGTVHYLDAQGNETLVLSGEEAIAYEQSQQTAREKAVQESTDLLDIHTTTLVPRSVTEVTTAADGTFPDFMLGNGHLVLLRPEAIDGYTLCKDDRITLSLNSNDACILEFGMVSDGKTLETATAKAQFHTHTFTIPHDGDYNFYIMYYSVDKSAFTNCTLTIH